MVYQFTDFVGYAPVEAFDLGAGLEVDDAVAEKVEGLVAYVLRVVPVLKHGTGGEFVPYLREVVNELVVLLRGMEILVHVGHTDALHDIDDEHGVVCGERAAPFGDEVGMGYVVLVGSVNEGVHAVVDVLLDGIVHGTFGVAGACAVVVHAEAAAAVDKFDVEAQCVELHVELCRLAQGGGDAAYFGDLRTDVEVDELEAVVHAHLVEHLQCFEQFRGVEAELGGVAAALLPLARAGGGQLDADAQVGAHAELLGGLGDGVQLGQLFHHEEHALAHLLPQQGQLDEVLVLVAVAHDEAVAIHVGGQHGVELGFGAGLQAQVVLLAVADDFLHHGAHLVHLDWIDDEVLGLVVVLRCGAGKAVGSFFDAVVEDVGEAQKHGSCYIARVEFVDHFFEVNAHAVLTGRHVDVAFLVYAEVVDSPTFDVVEFLGIFNSPFSHGCLWFL